MGDIPLPPNAARQGDWIVSVETDQPGAEVVAELEQIVQSGRALTVAEATRFIDELLELHPSGGSLHIVVDDGNLEDRHVESCVQYAREHGDRFGELLALGMLRMTFGERDEATASEVYDTDHILPEGFEVADVPGGAPCVVMFRRPEPVVAMGLHLAQASLESFELDSATVGLDGMEEARVEFRHLGRRELAHLHLGVFRPGEVLKLHFRNCGVHAATLRGMLKLHAVKMQRFSEQTPGAAPEGEDAWIIPTVQTDQEIVVHLSADAGERAAELRMLLAIGGHALGLDKKNRN